VNQASLFENRQGPSHHNAPETSRQAAEANMPRSGTQRAKVLLTIYYESYRQNGYVEIAGEGGLTLDEIANVAGMIGNSVRPRRKELEEAGLVEDSGFKRSSNMGQPAVVWCLTDLGLRAAKELAA
jgi:hypothetical protein